MENLAAALTRYFCLFPVFAHSCFSSAPAESGTAEQRHSPGFLRLLRFSTFTSCQRSRLRLFLSFFLVLLSSPSLFFATKAHCVRVLLLDVMLGIMCSRCCLVSCQMVHGGGGGSRCKHTFSLVLVLFIPPPPPCTFLLFIYLFI